MRKSLHIEWFILFCLRLLYVYRVELYQQNWFYKNTMRAALCHTMHSFLINLIKLSLLEPLSLTPHLTHPTCESCPIALANSIFLLPERKSFMVPERSSAASLETGRRLPTESRCCYNSHRFPSFPSSPYTDTHILALSVISK